MKCKLRTLNSSSKKKPKPFPEHLNTCLAKIPDPAVEKISCCKCSKAMPELSVWEKCPRASLNHQRSFCVNKRDRGEMEGQGEESRRQREGKEKKEKGIEIGKERKPLKGEVCITRRDRGGRVYGVLIWEWGFLVHWSFTCWVNLKTSLHILCLSYSMHEMELVANDAQPS